MTAPESGVKVRMYRQGLGDCFLLAFPTGPAPARPFYLLIDCGVLVGTPDASRRMEEVAASLRDATGGRIDLLVATHQHWDHLSGFEQARQTFDEIEFGEVWVAWTEDPGNDLARRLRARRERTIQALHAAVRGFRSLGAAERAAALAGIVGFFGELGADGRPSRIQSALEYVLGRGHPPGYRKPGEALQLPGVARARVFVLGPPEDEKLLLRSNPSRRTPEVYEKRMALTAETAFLAAALGAAGDTDADFAELSQPFEEVYRVDLKTAKQDKFFQDHYFGVAGQASEKAMAWRRIDEDWLGSSDALALQLDSDTNNTSLALAIELSPGGKVLLFPGDAQVGNWLSWDALSWPGPDGSAGAVTAADLLRRTVLYKVGHHASHNATLRAQGLERMESPDLVAMIPVHETFARESKGWDMPFGPLLDRLEEKTAGRVLRADSGLPSRPEGVSAEDWQAFRDRCAEDRLYVEVTIPG
jgi:glyoxylase-like metal-dependent hydrolase (beta-lactamase superfamily II)